MSDLISYAGCDITDEEKEYIANDVLVVKEALEFMFNRQAAIDTEGLDEEIRCEIYRNMTV